MSVFRISQRGEGIDDAVTIEGAREIVQGQPPVPPRRSMRGLGARSGRMVEPHTGGADDERLTVAGCILTTLSFIVTIGSAMPVVFWRDSAGRPLPRAVAIATPFLIGATFNAIGLGILRVFGLRVTVKKPGKKMSEQDDWAN
jgi:hypothetical protein